MNRGDVCFYTFKAPDKRRPVVILTRDSLIGRLGEVTIAPITSTVRGIPSEVTLTPADGLPSVCAINLDHVQTVQKDKIGRTICSLSEQKLSQVQEAILFALGFDQ